MQLCANCDECQTRAAIRTVGHKNIFFLEKLIAVRGQSKDWFDTVKPTASLMQSPGKCLEHSSQAIKYSFLHSSSTDSGRKWKPLAT